MATVERFEDLRVWKLAREVANDIVELYIGSELFSRDFKLRDQINAASGSIMDNIAEGFGRDGTKEFIMFLSYSKGSAAEVKSQLYRALDRKYITAEQFNRVYQKLETICKKIGGFINYLNSSEYKGQKFKNKKLVTNTENPKPKTVNPKP